MTDYKSRMQKKKAHIDSAIEKADIERGVVILLTGNGKGKSSSALGMVMRALGHDMKVGVVQFIKSWTNTGEQLFLDKQPNVDFHIMGTGFTWDTQDKQKDIDAANVLWQKGKAMLADEQIDLVVFDELTYMFNYDYLDFDEFKQGLLDKPANQHVVITGRAADERLIELADTVSDLKDVKHAFRAGVKAMPGIEW